MPAARAEPASPLLPWWYRAAVRRALCILGLVSLSCSSSSESRQSPAAAAAQGGQSAPPADSPPARTASDAGAATAAAPATPAGDRSACAADADCAFDDPCNPQRCLAAAAPAAVGCDKSRPPTGTCVCFEKRCALEPGPTHPKVAVDADCTHVEGCALDRAAGRCAPGRDDDLRPERSVGPRCDCDSHVPQRCHFSWLDPIACTSVDDCWVDPAPFSHPIKRPRAKKGKRFRPCKDGEVAPACQDGRCTLLAYGC